MRINENIFNDTAEKNLQAKNKAVFAHLREHGFSLPVIRWALMDLNGITLGRLTGGDVSISTASNTIAGRRRNEIVIEVLAAELGIPARILFPKEEG